MVAALDDDEHVARAARPLRRPAREAARGAGAAPASGSTTPRRRSTSGRPVTRTAGTPSPGSPSAASSPPRARSTAGPASGTSGSPSPPPTSGSTPPSPASPADARFGSRRVTAAPRGCRPSGSRSPHVRSAGGACLRTCPVSDGARSRRSGRAGPAEAAVATGATVQQVVEVGAGQLVVARHRPGSAPVTSTRRSSTFGPSVPMTVQRSPRTPGAVASSKPGGHEAARVRPCDLRRRPCRRRGPAGRSPDRGRSPAGVAEVDRGEVVVRAGPAVHDLAVRGHRPRR